MGSFRFLDPTSQSGASLKGLAPGLANLDGMRVGFRQQWKQFDKFVDRLEQLVKSHYRPQAVARVDGTFSPRQGGKQERWLSFQKQVDCAVLGLGTCWGTAPWTVYDAVELEEQGIPTVSIITNEFSGLARAVAAARGYPSLNIVVVPHFFESLSDEAAAAVADESFGQVMGRIVQARA